MNYREVKPNGFLSNFVQCFWEYKTVDTDKNYIILPDGYFDLIAIFEDGLLKIVVLTGVWTKPIKVLVPRSAQYIGIRFKLLAVEYLFRQEIKSILDTSKQLPDTFWNINNYKANEFEKFVSDIVFKLNSSVKHLSEIDNRKLKLFEVVYSKNSVSVEELSKKVFWTSRQINRYFNNNFGFPVKEFLKIVRCRVSYTNISNGKIFPEIYFFDQSHFIKEIKRYTGVTPTKLYRNENDRFLQLLFRKHK